MKRYCIAAVTDLPTAPQYSSQVTRALNDGNGNPILDANGNPVTVQETQWQQFGEWHAIDLGSHGATGAGFTVIVITDDHVTIPASWTVLPHLLSLTAPLNTGLLADLGIATSSSMLAAMFTLAGIHSKFKI